MGCPSVSRIVGFTGRPSGYRWNRESTALPLQCCHLFKQIAEKPSEESVFGNPNYPSRRGPIIVLTHSLNPSVAFPQR
jgi:hypothetical protein